MILSIVMPAFNARGHLLGTLVNVAPLLGDSAELIFVDDGSTDGTPQHFLMLARSIPLQNARLIRQGRGGVSEARNQGCANARGEYVLFLDSDDFVSPDLLDEVERAAARSEPDVICWGWDTIGPTGELLRRYFDVHPQIQDLMDGEEALFRRVVDRSLRVWTGSAAYRRAFMAENSLAFTPGCSVGEDLEFSYLALLAAKEVVFVPRVLSTYQKRLGSVTSKPSVARFDSVTALRRVSVALDADKRHRIRAIAARFRQTKVLVNFFFTLESCLAAQGAGSPSKFLGSVDDLFPHLTTEIRQSICQDAKALPAEWRIFARSPRCWWAWVRLRRRTDRFLPPRLRSTGAVAEKRRATLLAPRHTRRWTASR